MTKLDRRQVVGGLAALGALLGPLRAAFAAGKVAIDEKSVLIVVDVQNCFLPGGSLAVKDGEQVIPIINALAKGFANVVLTQDWHTPDHASFASTYKGKKPFDLMTLPYGDQVLWPDHCVQGTEGAAISGDISSPMPASLCARAITRRSTAIRRFTRRTIRRRPASPAISSSAD